MQNVTTSGRPIRSKNVSAITKFAPTHQAKAQSYGKNNSGLELVAPGRFMGQTVLALLTVAGSAGTHRAVGKHRAARGAARVAAPLSGVARSATRWGA